MYALIHRVGVHEGLRLEAPSLMVSMIVAELFYRFHSFSLECLAFLATWFVVSYLARRSPPHFDGQRTHQPATEARSAN